MNTGKDNDTKTLDILREMIIKMDISPGERLTERWLESIMNVSRTPIREALVRLQNEGLVERQGKMWICSPIDYNELHELCIYRESLESGIITCITEEKKHTCELDVMLRDINLIKPENYNFHIELAKLSDNRFFIEAMSGVLNKLSRLRSFSKKIDHYEHEEHEDILMKMCAGDAETAISLMKRHISDSSNRLISIMRETHLSIKSVRQ